ncbi:MAG: hypothetical protein HC866_24505 [Leptolyngbyaceae cyanobacterium RU_5_1]|nr:hypothetical protein [Leptolyngbyaceae cyanobacterium RU_5_1]
MQLNEYPTAISDLQKEILHIDQKLRAQRETVAFCLNSIDRAIAFDQVLKNDSQRKAKRTELMETDADYIKANGELKRLEDLRAELDIDLQLLRNTFSLLKLERREKIAQIELNAAIAA